MIKIEELKHFLELQEADVEKLSEEQLQLLIGILRYSARVAQRELNRRSPSD
jgi:hypothetical protein